MGIVIAGGHGQIALRLERLLTDEAVGIVRNPAHVADVEATGARAVLLDLEGATAEQVAEVVRGADAVVFAAGAGPGSGAARKDTVDRAASVLLADAAEQAGIRRFVQISSLGAGTPPGPGADDTWAAYLRAKTAAEADLRARDLDWVILRPGGLTDDPGTGRVTLTTGSTGRGMVTRDDVAAVTAALLREPAVRRVTLELIGGRTPIADAVAAIRG